MQCRTEVTTDSTDLHWKRSHNVAALGCCPTLPTVKLIKWFQKQILNSEILMPPEFNTAGDVLSFDNYRLVDL